MLFPGAVSLLAFAVSAVVAAPQARSDGPAITAPPSGSVIAPGEAFNLSCDAIADYGVSTYHYTVWLFTSVPTSFAPSANWNSGHYFGRFDLANYPAVLYPKHPAPPQLVMPDFSKNPGGFGSGTTASNQKTYLTVLEEWATNPGVVGDRIALSTVEVIYSITAQGPRARQVPDFTEVVSCTL